MCARTGSFIAEIRQVRRSSPLRCPLSSAGASVDADDTNCRRRMTEEELFEGAWKAGTPGRAARRRRDNRPRPTSQGLVAPLNCAKGRTCFGPFTFVACFFLYHRPRWRTNFRPRAVSDCIRRAGGFALELRARFRNRRFPCLEGAAPPVNEQLSIPLGGGRIRGPL